MAVLTHQGAVAGVDRVQHALGVEHAPNALAGTVSLDHEHDADHRGAHHAAAADNDDHRQPASSDQGTDDGVRSHHHHAGEASQFGAPDTDGLPALVLTTGAALDLPMANAPASWLSARLERPPKPLSI